MKSERQTEMGEILGNELVSQVKITFEFLIDNPDNEMFPMLLNLVNALNDNQDTQLKLGDAVKVEKAPEKEVETFCSVHNKQMKERKNNKGGTWYDHRQQTNGNWELCYGKGYPSEK